jgi:hypothetical protein
MRYRLQTLVILTVVGPPLLAVAWRTALLVPRPRSYAEAFTCFLVCFNLMFIAGYIAVRWTAYRRSRQQNSN